MKSRYDSESALCAAAAEAARRWRDGGLAPLAVGLRGGLGAGKTTWVRALLGGLGHAGRVPSPTYTLLEQYEIGSLTVVHLDLYRLAEPGELDFIGLRDWVGRPHTWILAEWPERGGRALADVLDLLIDFTIEPDQARILTPEAVSGPGRQALEAGFGSDFK